MIKNNKNVITGKEKNKSNYKLRQAKSKLNFEINSKFTNRKDSSILKPTKTFNKKIIIHNTILSREEMKNKKNNITRNIKNKRNSKISNNYTKLYTTNNLNLKKDAENISKEKEKKIQNKFKKNNSNLNKMSIPKLNDLFKKNYLKQTIIIDNEGNNNLNLNPQHIGQKDYKNILDINKFQNFNEKTENANSNTFSEINEKNSLFEDSNNYNSKILINIDKEKGLEETFTDKNKEEKRLKEYNKIFNLLNTNIEQFKKMFNSNINDNNIDKNENENEKDDKNKKIIIKKKLNTKTSTIFTGNNSNLKDNIFALKENNNNLNLKKNLSDKNIKCKKSNNKLLQIDIDDNNLGNDINNNYINTYQENNEINNNLSFLESSIDNEFYQSLINQTFLQNISRISFEINNTNKENFNINSFGEMENLPENNTNKKKKDKFNNNPNQEKGKMSLYNWINFNQNDYKKYLSYLDKNNCYIF